MTVNYKQLLLKYINHVGIEEGTTFLGDHNRSSWPDSPQFTDEEWAALEELNKVNYEKEFVTHSCSCHARNAGPCDVCKVLGCEVWDFNQVAQPIGRVLETRMTDAGFEADVEFFCTGEKDCRGTTHANDCPKWEE